MRSCLRNSIPNFLRRSYIACCHCCGNGMEIGKKRIWKGSGTDIKYHKRPNWSTECSIFKLNNKDAWWQDEEDGFTTPGDEVRGRLHWQYFLDGRVGLALLRSPRTPQPNPYSQQVWTVVGHEQDWQEEGQATCFMIFLAIFYVKILHLPNFTSSGIWHISQTCCHYFFWKSPCGWFVMKFEQLLVVSGGKVSQFYGKVGFLPLKVCVSTFGALALQEPAEPSSRLFLAPKEAKF